MWKSVSDCACAEPNFQKSLNRRVQVCRHNFYGGLGEARAFIPVAQGCSGQRQAGGAPDECLCSTAPRLHGAVRSRARGWGLAAGTERATGINGSHGSPASLQEMVVALRLGGISAALGARAAHGAGLCGVSERVLPVWRYCGVCRLLLGPVLSACVVFPPQPPHGAGSMAVAVRHQLQEQHGHGSSTSASSHITTWSRALFGFITLLLRGAGNLPRGLPGARWV